MTGKSKGGSVAKNPVRVGSRAFEARLMGSSKCWAFRRD